MKLSSILTYGLLVMAIPTITLAKNSAEDKAASKATKVMDKFDVNDDGKVSMSEVAILQAKRFDDADRNSDGFISHSEKKLLRLKRKNTHRERLATRRLDRQSSIDSNGDGEISLSEFTAQPSPLFTRLDSNKDGSISSSEVLEARKKKFLQLDMNNDGVLNRADRKAATAKRLLVAKQTRTEMDVDQDGRISRAEFLASKGRFMNKFDSNNDDIATYNEIRNVIADKINHVNKRR
ncbi:MAG: hypothetical protein JKY46_03845 [Robiginitomaculum sp.]|nr:hypothetical protein [Robiginitomaculum sp.]